MEIFDISSSSRSSGAKNRQIFTMLEQHFQSQVVGNLEVMGYGTFNRWMNGTITSKHYIKPIFMRVFQSFVDNQNS